MACVCTASVNPSSPNVSPSGGTLLSNGPVDYTGGIVAAVPDTAAFGFSLHSSWFWVVLVILGVLLLSSASSNR